MLLENLVPTNECACPLQLNNQKGICKSSLLKTQFCIFYPKKTTRDTVRNLCLRCSCQCYIQQIKKCLTIWHKLQKIYAQPHDVIIQTATKIFYNNINWHSKMPITLTGKMFTRQLIIIINFRKDQVSKYCIYIVKSLLPRIPGTTPTVAKLIFVGGKRRYIMKNKGASQQEVVGKDFT